MHDKEEKLNINHWTEKMDQERTFPPERQIAILEYIDRIFTRFTNVQTA